MVAEHEPLLAVEGLTKFFPVSRRWLDRHQMMVHAVEDVSFKIASGETLALVGESGSGKSTTARLILRLLTPTSGRVLFNGQDIHALEGRALNQLRKEMQIVFQNPGASLNPRKTIFEILRDPLLLHRMASPADVRDQVVAALERVGLSPARHFLGRNPREFSGGQLQRICVARAISLHSQLVVADEPVSALDVSVRAQILQLMQSLQQESRLSYLFITHDLAVVRAVAHRVAVMYLGQIVECGPVIDIFTQPQHPYTQALLSATPVPNPRRARQRQRIMLSGEIPSPVNPPPGCRFHTRCPAVMELCRTQAPAWQTIGSDHQVACHLVTGIEKKARDVDSL